MSLDIKDFYIKDGESIEEFCYRVCKAKDDGSLGGATWTDIARVINAVTNTNYSESFYRKNYAKIKKESASYYDEAPREEKILHIISEIEKNKIAASDMRNSYRKQVRNQARRDSLYELFENAIVPFASPNRHTEDVIKPPSDIGKAIYALLGDLHYGISFSNAAGMFNGNIARERLMRFRDEIIIRQDEVNAKECYISLLGDLISGNIHKLITVENRENVVSQVVNISEILSEVIADIADCFDNVYVNNVNGNHSRVIANPDEAPNSERLDALVPIYCKLKLANYENVKFEPDMFNGTINCFDIFGYNYVTVHGDMDRDIKNSRIEIEALLGKPIDVFCFGHMHTFKSEYDKCLYIQNGSLCGSGDEYTVRKRLFGSPEQTILVCSDFGVESISPIML